MSVIDEVKVRSPAEHVTLTRVAVLSVLRPQMQRAMDKGTVHAHVEEVRAEVGVDWLSPVTIHLQRHPQVKQPSFHVQFIYFY